MKMAKEHAVCVKRRKKQKKKKTKSEKICIIHLHQNKNDKVVRSLSEVSFDKIKKSASVRRETGDNLDICDNIPENLDISLHDSAKAFVKLKKN